MKRSIKSSNNQEDSISKSKKIKTDDIGIVDNKKAMSDKINESILKRSSDLLSDSNQCLSPSKKRKIVVIQEVSGEIEKRKKRMKKKALLKAVLDQMEFYFSDSNLSKDRFLRKLYDQSEDGYVDLSVFSNFNKLQSLLKDGNFENLLCKALARSKILELNLDGNKVRRRKAFVELDKEEVDKRTIYVEQLPNHASHAWIKKMFSPCGKVVYVSLPVYQTTKEIKGFAFVEFASPEEAQKACSMLNNPLPAKTEEKPGKFPKGNKFLYRAQKIAPTVKMEEQDSNEENLQGDSKEDQKASPIKKKKKKKLKKKTEEATEKFVTSEQYENQEDKKKKKKKKKKQVTVTTSASDGERGSCKTESESEMSEKDILVKTMEDDNNMEVVTDDKLIKKREKKKIRKKLSKLRAKTEIVDGDADIEERTGVTTVGVVAQESEDINTNESNTEIKLSRKERKLLRQKDIRKKKAEREFETIDNKEHNQTESERSVSGKHSNSQLNIKPCRERLESIVSESSETDDSSRVFRKSDGSQLTSCLVKSKKQDVIKKVEFDPVPITTEFVERKEIRRRKKQKRESLHLRVISKKEWLSLREEYISKQKSHMAALKETLRELRMQEGTNQMPKEQNGKKHVDLASVFGTKRMKPSEDVKLAHLEELKFIPNVIVQWKCSHEISRNKIKNLFPEIKSDNIAYIEGKEEAKSGYIRFKNEESAEEFAKLSRSSDSFSARVLPETQQASYWEKANKDRVAKLSRKKNERGADRIARKVFERNKVTFHEKGTRIVFDDDEDNPNDGTEDETKNESGILPNIDTDKEGFDGDLEMEKSEDISTEK